MKKTIVFLTSVLLVLGGCSGGGKSANQAAPTPMPSVASTIDFPIYAGSRVLVAKTFTQVLNNTNAAYNGVLMGGNGKYEGNEVIAASPASFDQLRGWVRASADKPPAGYTTLQQTNVTDARSSMQRYGMDFQLFQRAQTGKAPVGLIVIVMDPARVTKSLGPALGLIARYRSLPDFAKKPIDDQVKAQTGFSVTEALQPESPLGIALDALNQFSHSDQRAILLVNAQKQ